MLWDGDLCLRSLNPFFSSKPIGSVQASRLNADYHKQATMPVSAVPVALCTKAHHFRLYERRRPAVSKGQPTLSPLNAADDVKPHTSPHVTNAPSLWRIPADPRLFLPCRQRRAGGCPVEPGHRIVRLPCVYGSRKENSRISSARPAWRGAAWRGAIGATNAAQTNAADHYRRH